MNGKDNACVRACVRACSVMGHIYAVIIDIIITNMNKNKSTYVPNPGISIFVR